MTAKADFTPEEWRVVLEGPPSAGMIVVTAQRGGTFRETIAMAKAYVEARKQHGESELLDEIVSAKPEIDHTRYRSVEELALPVLLARLHVGLRHRDRLPESSSTLGGDDDHPGAGRTLQYDLPLLRREITPCCHAALLSLVGTTTPRT